MPPLLPLDDRGDELLPVLRVVPLELLGLLLELLYVLPEDLGVLELLTLPLLVLGLEVELRYVELLGAVLLLLLYVLLLGAVPLLTWLLLVLLLYEGTVLVLLLVR